MSAGRPLKYNTEILSKTQEYINNSEDAEEQVLELENEEKGYKKYKTKIRVHLPTIEGLARFLSVHKDTIYQWRKDYAEFSDLIETLLHKQSEALINNGLSGDYNPTIAKVLLSKHGYRESSEVEVAVNQSQTFEIAGQKIKF